MKKKFVSILLIFIFSLTSTLFSSGYLKCHTLKTAHLNCHLEKTEKIKKACCKVEETASSKSINNLCCEKISSNEFNSQTFSTDKIKLNLYPFYPNFVEYDLINAKTVKISFSLATNLQNPLNQRNLYKVNCVFRC